MEELSESGSGQSKGPPFESDRIEALASGVERWIRERPMTALVAAVVAGYVVARVLRDE